jgi:hypothetical protein
VAWLSLLAAALAVRVAAGLWWQSRLPVESPFQFGDSDSYWHLAGNVAGGGPFQYGTPDLSVFRTPGYPVILSVLFWFSDDPPVWSARILNALLGLTAVLLCAVLAREMFGDRRVTWLAALLASFYPGAISMSVFVLSEAPFCPCLLAQLVCWLRATRAATRRQALWWWALTGASGAAAALMRPSWLLFPVAVAAFEAAFTVRRQAAAAHALAVLLGLSLLMSPWWIRNYQVTGRFVPTTLQLGASLYDGLSPTATGASDMRAANQAYRDLKAEDRRLGRPRETFELRLNQQLRDAALAWAREHPGEALRLAAVKFRRMWNLWPNSAEFRSWPLRLLVAAGFVPLAALAVVGLVLRRRCAAAWMCLAPAAYLTALHMVFVSSIRYRQPAMLAITPVAAYAAWWLLRPARSEPAAGGERAS